MPTSFYEVTKNEKHTIKNKPIKLEKDLEQRKILDLKK